MKVYSVKDIRNSVVYSFLKKDPCHFIPFLMSDNVSVDDDNKVKFYNQFRHNILNANIKGKIAEIKVEIELNGFYDDYLQLNFYDEFHINPRFSIFYKYEGEKIHFGLMPF